MRSGEVQISGLRECLSDDPADTRDLLLAALEERIEGVEAIAGFLQLGIAQPDGGEIEAVGFDDDAVTVPETASTSRGAISREDQACGAQLTQPRLDAGNGFPDLVRKMLVARPDDERAVGGPVGLPGELDKIH